MSKLFRLLPLAFTAVVLLFATGCNTSSSYPKDFTPTLVRFYLEERNSNPANAAASTLPLSGKRIVLDRRAILSELDIMSVTVVPVPHMGNGLLFQFTPAASRDLYRTSVRNQGLQLVITIDNLVVGATMISRPLTDVPIYLELPDDAVLEVAKNINATSYEIQKRR
jgi:hypothetical protein